MVFKAFTQEMSTLIMLSEINIGITHDTTISLASEIFLSKYFGGDKTARDGTDLRERN